MNLSSSFNFSPAGQQQLHQRGFEIIFSQFESMCNSNDIIIQEFIHTVGKEEFYESLKFEFSVLYSLIYTKNTALLKDFYLWKYSVYFHRGLDCEIFLLRFESWQNSFFNNLHKAHATALNHLFQNLISMHEEFLKNAKLIPKLPQSEKHKNLIETLSLYLLNGKEKEGYMLIKEHLKEFKDIYHFIDVIIKPIMQRVGILWQVNQISVAKEHLATATIDAIVHKFIDASKEVANKKVLISTAGDELHLFGVKILSSFLTQLGYEVINLGVKNSTEDIISHVKDLNPVFVFLSATLPSNIAALQEIVSSLKRCDDFNGKVIVGGQALYRPKPITIVDADFQSNSLEELKEYLL